MSLGLKTNTAAKFSQKAKIIRLLPPCFLFIALVFQLSVRIAILERGYVLEDVRQTALRNDAERRALALDYAFLNRPSTLIAQASERLEMQILTPQQIRRFNG